MPASESPGPAYGRPEPASGMPETAPGMERWMDGCTDIQIPPVFYRTSSPFGAEALLTSEARRKEKNVEKSFWFAKPKDAFIETKE